MSEFLSFQIALPICKLKEKRGDTYIEEGDILGTCFSIGKGLLLTASHVIEPIIENHGIIGVFDRKSKNMHAIPIIDLDQLGIDVSIIKVEYNPEIYDSMIHTLFWQRGQLAVFSDVATIGYPHGTNITERGIEFLPRGLKGHIVSTPNSFQRIGVTEPAFGVYELSFQIPTQLSGAPLLTISDPPRVVGMVIGNKSTKTLIFQNEEIIEEEKTKVIVQQFDSMSLGIAIRQNTLFPLYSKMLGEKIADQISKNCLLG
jgi:hypothetical protein